MCFGKPTLQLQKRIHTGRNRRNTLFSSTFRNKEKRRLTSTFRNIYILRRRYFTSRTNYSVQLFKHGQDLRTFRLHFPLLLTSIHFSRYYTIEFHLMRTPVYVARWEFTSLHRMIITAWYTMVVGTRVAWKQASS